MKLQIRLLLFFIGAISIALLVFGVGIYISVYRNSINQMEATLRIAANQMGNTINIRKEIFFSGTSALDEEIVMLAWDLDETRLLDQVVDENLVPLWIAGKLPADYESDQSGFETVTTVSGDYYVYTAPVQTRFGQKFVLQARMPLASVYEFQSNLAQMMIQIGLIILGIAGPIIWWLTRRTIEPLQIATETALQITKANELSIRIPDPKKSRDEIGLLIRAFNTMLERMEELFNTQRRFLADISHELRTPLTAIRGNAGLMRRMQSYDPESLADIENEVGRMSRMVEDLLLLAQADAGKLEMESSMVELDTLILEEYQSIRATSTHNKVVIEKIDQVLVCGDSERLKQVVQNLIANAIKYTPENSQIELALGKVGAAAYFQVKDNGPGISKKDLPHIFDRFYRAEKSRVRDLQDRKGFGLGLSIANWIITEHMGKIEVISSRANGTTFTVWLPLFTGECPPKPLEIMPALTSKLNKPQ